MKKMTLFLYFIPLLLFCFAGCSEYSVQCAPVSPDMEAVVRQAVREAEFYETSTVTPDDLQISYYGAYNGACVFYWEGMAEAFLQGAEDFRSAFDYGTVVCYETVGGSEFRYSTLRPLQVCYEGRILSLPEAQEEGLLNRAELQHLAQAYAEEHADLYGFALGSDALSPKSAAEVEEAFSKLDPVGLPLDSDIYRYLGTFSGCEVFAVFGNFAEITTLTVGNEIFTYHSAMEIYVYENGRMIPVNTYYEEGKITDEEVSLMAKRYRTDWGNRPDWTAATFDGLNEEELQPYFDAVLAFTEEYSRTVYSADVAFSGRALPQTEQAKNYMNKKLEYQRIFGNVLGFTEDYVDGTFQISDWKSFGDTLVCKVAVTLRTRYSDTGTGSYSGQEVQIVLQNPRDPHVSDWHIDDVKAPPFETQVRGYGVDLFDSQSWLIHADPTALDRWIEEVLQERRTGAETVRRQQEAALGG